MGGLVARYFLECMDWWKYTRALITFGTPYRGSLNTILDFLANGFVKKVGPFKMLDLSELLRSLTSVYQLLPIYPCVYSGTGTLTRVAETTDRRFCCQPGPREGRREGLSPRDRICGRRPGRGAVISDPSDRRADAAHPTVRARGRWPAEDASDV